MTDEDRIINVYDIYDRYSSDFYDYYATREDIDFYLDYAKKTDGEILDVGCGTGRILIPVARLGKRITGIDKSDFMLDNLRQKLKKEPDATRQYVSIVTSDICGFRLDKTFSLAVIPFGPFNYLINTDEQLNCLSCIHNHLDNNGLLVFDVWYPDNKELIKSEHDYHVVKDQPYFTMEDGRKVQWGIINTSVDYNKQIIYEEMYYNVDYPDGRKEKLVYPSPVRFFYRYEIEHLLSRAGFTIRKLYSDFDRNEFGRTYPSELIIEAVKK